MEKTTGKNELRGLKVCMLLQTDFPPDIRVSKEARTLLENGAEIHLVCNNRFADRPLDSVEEGISVHRLPRFQGMGKLKKALKFPIFFNPVWIWKSCSVVRKFKIDVLHAHDIPFIPLAVVLGKLFSIPVIYDMHENYPEAFRTWKPTGIVSFFCRNYRLARIADRWCQRRVDFIIAVADELKEFLVEKGISPEKIFPVHNFTSPEILERQAIEEDIRELYRNSFNLLYIGNFSVDRGLDVPIKALSGIAGKIPEARLILAGTGKNIDDLKELAREVGVAERVVFTGWVDFKLYRTYITLADVCLVPQPSNLLIDTGIPHKLFQYMCLERCVVVSDAKSLKRIVTDAKCGRVFKSNDVVDFIRTVLSLRDRKTREELGRNGRRAVEKEYNWENASLRLLELYRLVYQRVSG